MLDIGNFKAKATVKELSNTISNGTQRAETSYTLGELSLLVRRTSRGNITLSNRREYQIGDKRVCKRVFLEYYNNL